MKFIRANSLSEARVQYKTASTLLLLSVYLAKAFLREHHWKVVKPSSKRLYSAPNMALMLLTEVFFVIPFQLGLMVPLFVELQSVNQQNIRRSWVVKKRARVLEALRTGTWRLVCVSSKAAFTSRRMRTKTCCRISLSLTWVTFSCSRQQNLSDLLWCNSSHFETFLMLIAFIAQCSHLNLKCEKEPLDETRTTEIYKILNLKHSS